MIEIRGADQLANLSKALKESGQRDLQRELSKAINRAVRPIKQEIQASAESSLPQRGGLAERAASAKLATRRRAGKKQAGVRVVDADRGLSLWHLNAGIVRHKIKGLPSTQWTEQRIAPGYWDRATEATGDKARSELLEAMDDVARKIDRAP